MSTDTEPLMAQLPRARSAYLIGPISGAQIGALLAAAIMPVPLLALAGTPALVLLVSLWTACGITAYRKAGHGGWWWVAFTVHAVKRQGDRGIFATTHTDALRAKPPAPAGKLFTAAPGLLRHAQGVLIPGYGMAFCIPQHAGAKRKVRVTTAWRVDGPAFDTATIAAENEAATSWSHTLDGLARLDGLVAITLHADTGRCTDIPKTNTGGAEVAQREYEILLATLADQPTTRVIVALTWNSKDAATSGWQAAAEQLTAGGLQTQEIINAHTTVARLLTAPQLTGGDPQVKAGQRPSVPTYRETLRGIEWANGSCTVGLLATSSIPVDASTHTLEPLMIAAKKGVTAKTAVLLRPVNKVDAQGRGRVRRAKLERTVASSNSSMWSSMLVDAHAAQAEIEALDELAYRGARGESEMEVVVMFTITAATMTEAEEEARRITANALPLLFTTVAFPAPLVFAVASPTGLMA